MRRSSYYGRLGLPFIVFLLFNAYCQAPHVSAQGGRDSTGTGGIHTIQGRIFFPSGRSSDTRANVELETSERGNLSTFCGADGSFRFSNLLAGSYTIVVSSGSEFETARESVYIDRDRMARVITVPIYLRYKHIPLGGQTGVLDASLIGIPKQALEQYKKGLESAQTGNSSQAIECFQKAIIIYRDFGPALSELGQQYLKTGQAEKAVDALRSAIKVSPEHPSVRLNYGIALLNTKKFVEAVEQLKQAIKKDDTSATAHMYIGLALLNLHQSDNAESELRRAVSLGQNKMGLAHKYLGGIYWAKHEYKQAVSELEMYLKLSPKAPDADRIKNTIEELKKK